MFVSIARHVVKEECIARYEEIAKIMVEKSRPEDGCLGYTSVAQQSDPRVHLFIEKWESDEAMKAHFETPHFKEYIPQLPEMFAEEEVVTRYDIIA